MTDGTEWRARGEKKEQENGRLVMVRSGRAGHESEIQVVERESETRIKQENVIRLNVSGTESRNSDRQSCHNRTRVANGPVASTQTAYRIAGEAENIRCRAAGTSQEEAVIESQRMQTTSC